MSDAEPGKMIRLTSIQRYKVMQWVDSWREQIIAGKWSAEYLTQEVRKKVDFPVSAESVRIAVKDLGITLTNSRGDMKFKFNEAREKIAALESDVERLNGVVRRLEGTVTHLVADLNTLLRMLDIARVDGALRSAVNSIKKG